MFLFSKHLRASLVVCQWTVSALTQWVKFRYWRSSSLANPTGTKIFQYTLTGNFITPSRTGLGCLYSVSHRLNTLLEGLLRASYSCFRFGGCRDFLIAVNLLLCLRNQFDMIELCDMKPIPHTITLIAAVWTVHTRRDESMFWWCL